jgi:SAM-dependent methyltransferase
MTRTESLRAAAEKHERRAAKLAAFVSAELSRPSSRRAPMTEALTSLRDHHRLIDDLMQRLRAELGVSRDQILRRARQSGTDERYFRMMQGRLSLFAKVLDAVDCIDAGHEWPLVPLPRARFDLGAAEETILARVFTRAHSAINPVAQAAKAADLGCFPDIPLNAGRFLVNAHLAYRVLLARKQERPFRFLDVGCGGGVKVVLAADLFDRTEGLDYDPGYVETALRTLAAMRAVRSAIMQADGLIFGGYGDFDVVYFYQPMVDFDGLHRLEQQIVTGAAPGTVLIAPYDGFVTRAAELGCAHLADSVYIVGLDETGVEALRSEVARIGPDIVNPDTRLPSSLAWLRDLWLACQANGVSPA